MQWQSVPSVGLAGCMLETDQGTQPEPHTTERTSSSRGRGRPLRGDPQSNRTRSWKQHKSQWCTGPQQCQLLYHRSCQMTRPTRGWWQGVGTKGLSFGCLLASAKRHPKTQHTRKRRRLTVLKLCFSGVSRFRVCFGAILEGSKAHLKMQRTRKRRIWERSIFYVFGCVPFSGAFCSPLSLPPSLACAQDSEGRTKRMVLSFIISPLASNPWMWASVGSKKSTQTFFVHSFSTTLRVMDVRAKNRERPHQKVRFPAAPVGWWGETFWPLGSWP